MNNSDNKSQNGFKKVSGSDQRMYGNRGIILCGYSIDEQDAFIRLLEKNSISELPVLSMHNDFIGHTLGDIIVLPDRSGFGINSNLARAAILSGITENELHLIISIYRDSEMPRQLWASLTPTSETWGLGDLLTELEREREEFKNRKQ